MTELEQMRAELEKTRAELVRAKSRPVAHIKVSAKGAVSVYGLGRFPVTLYATQWAQLLAMKEQIEDFIQNRKADLSYKGE